MPQSLGSLFVLALAALCIQSGCSPSASPPSAPTTATPTAAPAPAAQPAVPAPAPQPTPPAAPAAPRAAAAPSPRQAIPMPPGKGNAFEPRTKGPSVAPGVVVAPAIPAPPPAKPAAPPVRPADAAVQAATKDVREVYGADLDAAKTPEEKQAMAAKLLRAGSAESEIPSRAALLTLARTTAVEGGDLETAVNAVDAMNWLTSAEAVRLKATAATAAAKVLPPAANHAKFADLVVAIVDQATAADIYDVALPLGELALTQARLSNDASAMRDSALCLQREREAEAAFVAVKPAAAALAAKPTDPAANLEIGKYRCFIKADWQGGLPMIVLGTDAGLKKLAQQDLAGPTIAEDMIRLGDGWWDVAEKLVGPAKEGCQKRAAKWYQDALPVLPEGLTKTRIEKRLAAVPMADSNVGWTVLFRSADPSIWNKDVSRGANDFAISPAKAPAGVQFLKMSVPGAKVIISMINERLASRAPVTNNSNYWWTGMPNMSRNAYHLGIYDKRVRPNTPEQMRGMIAIIAGPAGRDSYSGWGFGSHVGYDDKQCCAWDGKEIQPTIFEISVKAGPLTAAEKRSLLE